MLISRHKIYLFFATIAIRLVVLVVLHILIFYDRKTLLCRDMLPPPPAESNDDDAVASPLPPPPSVETPLRRVPPTAIQILSTVCRPLCGLYTEMHWEQQIMKQYERQHQQHRTQPQHQQPRTQQGHSKRVLLVMHPAALKNNIEEDLLQNHADEWSIHYDAALATQQPPYCVVCSTYALNAAPCIYQHMRALRQRCEAGGAVCIRALIYDKRSVQRIKEACRRAGLHHLRASFVQLAPFVALDSSVVMPSIWKHGAVLRKELDWTWCTLGQVIVIGYN